MSIESRIHSLTPSVPLLLALPPADLASHFTEKKKDQSEEKFYMIPPIHLPTFLAVHATLP